MKHLGDQWIEIIDGQEHVVKAVEKVSEKSYDCTGCIFNGHDGTCMYHSQDCPLGEVEHGYIKDLGILRDGLLPCPFCGEYPRIGTFGDGFEPIMFYVTHDNKKCPVWAGMRTKSFESEQQAIDAWNRRA